MDIKEEATKDARGLIRAIQGARDLIVNCTGDLRRSQRLILYNEILQDHEDTIKIIKKKIKGEENGNNNHIKNH